MMQKFLTLCLLFFLVSVIGARVHEISREVRMSPNGRYHYHYSLDNGAKVSQTGYLKHVRAHQEGQAMEGKYSFIAKDGHEYAVTYIADEHGYRAVGEHLPTPPPVPLSVLKALKYIKEHPYETRKKQDH